MSDSLIIVKQLPVIEQRLREVKEANERKVDEILRMACTEDTVKDIKKKRAELSKEFQAFEEQRKTVKQQVYAPYEAFETIYKECVTEVYKEADSKLKDRIGEVEDTLKQEKAQEAERYFNEYRDSLGIDFVTFQDSKIAVTLGVTKKRLKEQAKAFLDGVADDLRLIETQEYPEEILVEYKRTLEVSSAIITVRERHAQILAEQERAARQKEQEQARAETVAQVDQAAEVWSAPQPVEAPEEEPEPPAEKQYMVHFTVIGTKGQMVALKQFLKEGGYRYE